jgi:hypothetical protein
LAAGRGVDTVDFRDPSDGARRRHTLAPAPVEDLEIHPSEDVGAPRNADGDWQMKFSRRKIAPQVDVPDLLVVAGDPVSDRALELVKRKQVEVVVVPVSADEYLSPRDVPKLMTKTGIFFGLPSIERAIDTEILPGSR